VTGSKTLRVRLREEIKLSLVSVLASFLCDARVSNNLQRFADDVVTMSLQIVLRSDDLPMRLEMSGNPIRCSSRLGGGYQLWFANDALQLNRS